MKILITESQYQKLIEGMNVVNRILDKINEFGIDSVTSEEKRILDDYALGNREKSVEEMIEYLLDNNFANLMIDLVDNSGKHTEKWDESDMIIFYTTENIIFKYDYKNFDLYTNSDLVFHPMSNLYLIVKDLDEFIDDDFIIMKRILLSWFLENYEEKMAYRFPFIQKIELEKMDSKPF